MNTNIAEMFENNVHSHFRINFFNDLRKFNCIIAGGALTSLFTNKKINDYDIYFKNEKDLKDAIEFFTNSSEYKLVHTSDNAQTFTTNKKSFLTNNKLVFQLIIAEHLIKENPMDIINNFDFSINMAAYDLNEQKLVTKDKFFYDNIKRELIFNENTYYPIISMHRAIKYINRGYTLPGYEQVKICLAINNLKMKNYRDLKAQLQGIDTSEFSEITAKLMESPEENYSYDKALSLLKENIKEKENVKEQDNG